MARLVPVIHVLRTEGKKDGGYPGHKAEHDGYRHPIAGATCFRIASMTWAL